MSKPSKTISVSIDVPRKIFAIAIICVLVYRKLRYGYAFRRIKLTQEQYAIVDVEDYARLIQYKWYAKRTAHTFYANRYDNGLGGCRLNIGMHRDVIMVGEGLLVDHINGNGLDNRKVNLRAATMRQNSWHRLHGKVRGKSRYKGVWWDKSTGKWRAGFTVDSRRKHLGYFKDEIKAARAYDSAVLKYRGEYAVPNFPDE